MSNPLAGRTARITSSTQGLGLTVACRLAAAGANIVLSEFAEPGAIAMVEREQEASGIRTPYSAVDLSRPDGIAVGFPCSAEEQDIPGAALPIDGGWTAI